MHPLQSPASMEIGKPYAAVRAERVGKLLMVIPGTVEILRADTKIAQVPDKLSIVDANKNPIMPSGRFYMTTETIDPYHMVLDLR